MVVGKGWVLSTVSLIAIVIVVADETFWIAVVMEIMMICTRSILLLLPGLLSKAMSNKVQNLHLSRVLLPY